MRRGDLRRAVNVVECTRLDDAAEAQADTQGLLFHASVPLQVGGRALGILNVATDEWQFLTAEDLQLLTAVGAQVSIALERARLYEVARAQQVQLARELAMAREVQASLLPRPLPSLPGFALAADWRSAREMAGDFYDVFGLPAGRWALAIADVSDKGAPAALYMAMVRSLLRAQAGQAAAPAEVLATLNRALIAQCSAEMFVSVFFAELEPAGRRLRWANAGHNPPLVRRASGVVEALPRGGPVLGMLAEVEPRSGELTLAPGEALALYTDGVTDAQDAGGGQFGLARLMAALAGAPPEAAGVLAHVLAEVGAFAGGAPQIDDLTLLVLTCPSPEAR
jgi:sigma-B regulation protein RsbU (phosphoserine phosphatase)